MYVEITFSNLDDHDKSQFSKYVIGDEIRVSKQTKKGENAEYHGYRRMPVEPWLREENAGDFNSRGAIDETPLKEFVPISGRVSKEAVIRAQQEFLGKYPEIEVVDELEINNFLGEKNVAQGIFGAVHFIPAVKNAGDEFKAKSSIFGELLGDVINKLSSTNENYKDVKEAINGLANLLNKRIADGSLNPDRPRAISDLENMLEAELERNWDVTIDIEITPPDIDDALKLGTKVWINDPTPTDVNRKGHGLQRSLIFALIKVWAKISQEEKSKAAEEKPRSASQSTFFIFEEPELYLHPQAQRELYSSLKELSTANNQVFLSTHSSSFINLEEYKTIGIVYKNDLNEGTRLFQCTTEIFPSPQEIRMFNMTYWINPDRGEMFLAKKVLLLEGQTDKTVIPFLAKQIGVFRYEYTLVDCGGKENISIYLQLLNKFRIPYVAVYDRDHQSGKNPAKIADADAASQTIESQIERDLGKSVILDNDIEEEIGLPVSASRNKAYFALEHVSATSFSISATFEAKIREMFI